MFSEKNPAQAQEDLAILQQLNLDYLSSDQNCNVQRYEQFLAPEFTASLPDFNIYDRKTFLEMIAKPRPFTDLQCSDVQITLLGDVALVHARMTLKSLRGVIKQGRYTDEYQRRDGKWWCIGANVIAENITADM
jgi:ketosteroid isomerase-like protein